MIPAPTDTSDDLRRLLECKRAIEPSVVALMAESATPYLDAEALLGAILPAALEAGWRGHEVQAALGAVVAKHRPARSR